MGEYFKVRAVEGLRQSAPEPTEQDQNLKSYFKWLKVVGKAKESSTISNISFSQSDHLCSISFGTKVKFYDYENQTVCYTYNSSKSFVRCASFRPDSKLAAVSDDSGNVDVVALELKSLLRRFMAHEGPCHCHAFSFDKLSLLTGGDDSAVKLWDVAQETCSLTLNGHTDRVRWLTPVSGDCNLWATACYDKIARVYDIRTPEKPVTTLQMDSPVEHVSISSSGFSLITTGGNQVKVWDISSGLKLELTVSPHLRAITRSFLSDDDNLLITSSLDGTVKYSDINNGLKVSHMYRFDGEITSFDFKYNNALAVGLSTSDWLIRYNNKLDSGNDIGSYVMNGLETARVDTVRDSVEVLGYKPMKLGLLDRLVRTFQYKAAMDLALTLTTSHVYNLIELLILRGTLSTAVRNRDEKTILPLLKFVSNQINKDINNTNLLLEFLITILDNNRWLKECTDEAVLAEMKRIPNKINLELYQHTILLRLKGLIDLII
ncbi:WD domain G-beta repeat protein [Theileria parva strain Muguga]|uniref:WD domain G-beta repeat protein n=1 Tax=Theileria parva strain Muguga TaxID=333668 RepID=UPI001C622F93|nr:WD domain G-beta repeat protein [Theileria parva strain Muguga]EAN34265.2 WD domain G-beta repeat protein [Theileria parva strain Muguga]